jgi:hypothetical protein
MTTPQPTSLNATATTPTSTPAPADDSTLLAKGKKLLGLDHKQEIGPAEAHAFERASTLLPSPPLSASVSDRRASPRGSPHMVPMASPTRRAQRSTSPASSQIFERNVQEPELSPAIPAHIQTEDRIPPALDASSLAITDDHLNPDKVEIVMHSAHQRASTAVAGSMADSLYSPSLPPDEATAASSSAHVETNESTPNYGSLDSEDVRRLSFISFADVVQAEHVENDRESFGPGDSIQFMSLSSPPTSSAASEKGMGMGMGMGTSIEHARTRSPGSPTSASGHVSHSTPLGEELPLQVETMRQAIRKTGTGESPSASQPLSPVSVEETAFR